MNAPPFIDVKKRGVRYDCRYVEQAFQKYADGATMTDLRVWLKAHNIKNTLGGEMSYNTIQRMLSNRRYIGELRLLDVVQPNAIPALVSQELFDRVQEKLAKNKKAPARHKAEDIYLLTTKLYCGKCGALIFGESGVSHTGRMYTYSDALPDHPGLVGRWQSGIRESSPSKCCSWLVQGRCARCWRGRNSGRCAWDYTETAATIMSLCVCPTKKVSARL